MQNEYNAATIEKEAQEYWDQNNSFVVVEDASKEKYFCLSMLPYPSGRLHMGHVRNYSIGDVISRYQKMLGKNVMQPIGWDAFGLPAENAAIKNQVPPAGWTYENIKHMKEQLVELGFGYDWSRELATCHPEYYRWEQWFFVKLFEKGLVYKKKAVVNWDPVDQTVLANEQVVEGCGWRSGAPVEKKEISQWYMKITDYAEELLADIQKLDGWPDAVKMMQTNWIGKSVGLDIKFKLNESEALTVYTTRPDTLLGVTYLAIAAEHPLAIQAGKDNNEIQTFLEECKKMETAEAAIETMEKKGVDSGLTCIHPITGESTPIWIANFVLMGYGTGAVMSVPAHDQRDYEFAKKYNISIVDVIADQSGDVDTSKAAFTEKGILINSGEFNGLNFDQAFTSISEKLSTLKMGELKTNYRLRDWGVSRQRYWGCPIPIINCPSCGDVAESLENLPVRLPENVELDGVGSPLKKMPDFYSVLCPKCGAQSERETDTFDTFFESSWYFARFTDLNPNQAFTQEAIDYWLPVDQYIGGIEHAVMHLLYSRFFMRALKVVNMIDIKEPFTALETQGMVCHQTFKDSNEKWLFPSEIVKEDDKYFHINSREEVIVGRTEKMSKSKKNVVDPQQIIDNYGADTARFFMLSDSPPNRDMEWSESGIEGSWRFLSKLWRFVESIDCKHKSYEIPKNLTDLNLNLLRILNVTIKEVTDSIESFHFNIAIASIRSLFNSVSAYEILNLNDKLVVLDVIKNLLILINPMVPHIAEELWETLQFDGMICNASWPNVNSIYLLQNNVEIPIQINGKMRALLSVPIDTSKTELELLALKEKNIKKFLNGQPKKVIIIPDRIVNFVI